MVRDGFVNTSTFPSVSIEDHFETGTSVMTAFLTVRHIPIHALKSNTVPDGFAG